MDSTNYHSIPFETLDVYGQGNVVAETGKAIFNERPTTPLIQVNTWRCLKSLSYDIVKAHGGELKVETKEGEGTEFIIQLPLI